MEDGRDVNRTAEAGHEGSVNWSKNEKTEYPKGKLIYACGGAVALGATGYALFLVAAAPAPAPPAAEVVRAVVLALARVVEAAAGTGAGTGAGTAPPAGHNVVGTTALTAFQASGYVQPETFTIIGVTSLASNQPLPALTLLVNVGTGRVGMGLPVAVYVGR